MMLPFRASSLWFVLVCLWVFLTGRIDVVSIGLGAIVSLVICRSVWRVFFSGIRKFPVEERGSGGIRILPAFFFVPRFLWSMVRASWEVSMLAISPEVDLMPGIVRIGTDVPDKTSLVFMANLITLTPGTLTLDADASKRDLFVHVLTLREHGVEGVRFDVSKTESMIRRLFG